MLQNMDLFSFTANEKDIFKCFIEKYRESNSRLAVYRFNSFMDFCAYEGHYDTLECLLSNRFPYNVTTLQVAAAGGNLEILELFYRYKSFSPDATKTDIAVPLQVIKWLITNGLRSYELRNIRYRREDRNEIIKWLDDEEEKHTVNF